MSENKWKTNSRFAQQDRIITYLKKSEVKKKRNLSRERKGEVQLGREWGILYNRNSIYTYEKIKECNGVGQ